MICVDVLTHEKKWSSFRGDKRIGEDSISHIRCTTGSSSLLSWTTTRRAGNKREATRPLLPYLICWEENESDSVFLSSYDEAEVMFVAYFFPFMSNIYCIEDIEDTLLASTQRINLLLIPCSTRNLEEPVSSGKSLYCKEIQHEIPGYNQLHRVLNLLCFVKEGISCLGSLEHIHWMRAETASFFFIINFKMQMRNVFPSFLFLGKKLSSSKNHMTWWS